MTTSPDTIVRNGPILDTYRAFEKLPFGGRWLFSRALCLKAPYFGSIRPRFDDLRPGFGRVRAPLRRAVKNHLGTFHAIACCNLAEVTAGSPAAIAGLQPGDVIVAVEDDAVSGAASLSRLISEQAPGATVELTILRDGDERKVEATLGRR